MAGFSKLEGDTCILQEKGVFKPCELWVWDGKLFAKLSGGFIRIRADGSTSRLGVQLEHMEFEGPLFADKFGRLTTQDGEGYRPLEVTQEGTLGALALEAPK